MSQPYINNYVLINHIHRLICCAIIIFFSIVLYGQQGSVEGVVKDGSTGETLIGANILAAEGTGTVTDFEGRFMIRLPYGSYNLQVSYVGYQTISQIITISNRLVFLEFEMSSVVIDEVIVIADVARNRETPVDYVNEQDEYPYRPVIYDMGTHYNLHWGYLHRDRFNENAPEKRLAERTNIYHKPQFTIRDFWTPTDKLSVSNILYLSIGTGGSIRPFSSMGEDDLIDDPMNPHWGLIDWQSVYDANAKPVRTPFGLKYPIHPEYSDSLYYSKNFMTNQHNDHRWFGLLSTANFQLNNNLDISWGLDLRSYKGIHYTTISDQLGGDYAVDQADKRIDYFTNPRNAMKFTGDTISYHEEGLVPQILQKVRSTRIPIT